MTGPQPSTHIPEHDAQVTCAQCEMIIADMHTDCNAKTLLDDADHHLATLVTQSLSVHEQFDINVLRNISHKGAKSAPRCP